MQINNIHLLSFAQHLRFALIVVELEAHAVVDLVVLESDMILVDVVPLLDSNLLRSRSGLRRHELLQIADRVIFVALDKKKMTTIVAKLLRFHALA